MHDPIWIKSLLGAHIAAGSTAFLMAPLALATAKSGKAHRRWGKIYFWAMAVVASTALVLALYRPLLFLALVAVFSLDFSQTSRRPIVASGEISVGDE